MKFNPSVFPALLLLIGGMLLTTGCPVGIGYPPAEPGSEKIDPKLLGIWNALDESADLLKVSVTKKDDNSYYIEVLESGDDYMIDETEFTAWVTKLDGKTFLYARPDGSSEETYYLYHYEFDSRNNLAIHDVSLLVKGTDGITSTETYREEISASLKKPDCLTSRFAYQKQ